MPQKDRRPSTLRPRLAAAATLALAITTAVLLAWLSQRYALEADWTRAGRHTLTSASVELIGRLRAPLEITAYAREEPELRDVVRRLVDRYRRHKADISLHFVNPDVVPDEVRGLGVTVNGELVLKYQGRLEHVRSDSEQEFANALQRLLRPGERWLAFVEGHGERSAVGKAGHDLGLWAEQLKQRGYRFQPMNLADTQAIPDNTAVLIIAGPRSGYLPGELDLVRQYVDRGGALLWLVDPGMDADNDAFSGIIGVSAPEGTVIDTAGRLVGLDDPTVALVTASLYGAHPALKDFSLTTFFPTAGALLPGTGDEWEWSPLLSTGNQAWLETGPLQGEVHMDAGRDLPGPLTLGAALTRPRGDPERGSAAGQQRVIVVADGDFLSNTYVSNSGNLELGLRLISWLSRDEDLVSIPARTAGDTQLDMSSTVLGILGVIFLLLLPLTFLAAGVTIWWRRSRL